MVGCLFAETLGLRASPTALAYIGGALGILAILAAVGKIPLQYNWRNIVVRWRTTLFTGLAFILVTALLVVMLAFVNGMDRLTEQSGQPDNVMVLSDGAVDEVFSNFATGDIGDLERQPGVRKNSSGRPLASKEAYMIATTPRPVKEGQPARRRFVQIRGLDDVKLGAEVHGLSLADGEWMDESDPGVQNRLQGSGLPLIRTVVGGGFAKSFAADFGFPTLTPGATFELAERTWIVVGVLDSEGTTYDSEVWAKRSLVGERFGKAGYTTVVLRTSGKEAAESLTNDLKQNFTKARINPQTELAYFSSLSATNRQFTFAIAVVAVFMAVGGAFGIMNTMFANVSQRSKDIGVLRILGFKRWQVLTSFLFETLVIALLGGLLGCLIATVFHGTSATSTIGGTGGGGKTVVLRLAVDANLIIVGVVFAFGMGLLGGLIPAFAATRVRPLESLR